MVGRERGVMQPLDSHPWQGSSADVDALTAGIVASASDATIAMDHDGTIVVWNAGCDQLFGWGTQEMRGVLLRYCSLSFVGTSSFASCVRSKALPEAAGWRSSGCTSRGRFFRFPAASRPPSTTPGDWCARLPSCVTTAARPSCALSSAGTSVG